MSTDRKIHGSLTVVRRINGEIGRRNTVSGSINRATSAYAPTYPGPYTVTPILYQAQVLETGGMIMGGDVTVNQIPITRTTNVEGGWTVVIG